MSDKSTPESNRPEPIGHGWEAPGTKLHDATLRRIIEAGYQLGDELANGGQAVIHEVTDQRTGGIAVAKIYKRQDPGTVRRADHEAKILHSTRMPKGLAPAYEFVSLPESTDDGQPFLVMDKACGRPLHVVAADQRDDSLAIATQFLSAVATLHRIDILHRDLSCSNVYWDSAAGITILDFGSASVVQTVRSGPAERPASSHAVQGGARLAPDDGRYDLRGAAAVIYQMFTGRPVGNDPVCDPKDQRAHAWLAALASANVDSAFATEIVNSLIHPARDVEPLPLSPSPVQTLLETSRNAVLRAPNILAKAHRDRAPVTRWAQEIECPRTVLKLLRLDDTRVVAGTTGSLAALDLHTGKLVEEATEGPEGAIITLERIADDQLVTVCEKGLVTRWHLPTLRRIGTPASLLATREPGHGFVPGSAITTAQLSSDKDSIICLHGGHVWLWCLREDRRMTEPLYVGRKHRAPKQYKDRAVGAIAPVGRDLVAVATRNQYGLFVDTRIDLWDTRTGKRIREGTVQSDCGIGALQSFDGFRKLLSFGGRIEVWDVSTCTPRGAPLAPDFGFDFVSDSASPVIRCYGNLAVVSDDGRRLLTASHARTLQRWDLELGQPRGRPVFCAHDVEITDMVELDDRHALTASLDGTLKVWDLDCGRSLSEPNKVGHLGQHDSAPIAVEVLGHTTRAVVTLSRYQHQIWDLEREEPLGSPVTAACPYDGHLSILDERQAIIVGSPLGIMDIGTGTLKSTSFGQGVPVLTATALRRSGRLATACHHYLRLWDIDQGRQVGKPVHLCPNGRPGGEPRVILALSPDETRVISACRDHVRVWRANDLGLIHDLRLSPVGPCDDSRPIGGLATLPDNRHVVVAHDDGSLRVIDFVQGAPVGDPILLPESARPSQQFYGLRDVVTFDDGRRAACRVYLDKDIYLFDLVEGRFLERLTGHRGEVIDLKATSIRGVSRLITISKDRTARVWDVKPWLAPEGQLAVSRLPESGTEEKRIARLDSEPDQRAKPAASGTSDAIGCWVWIIIAAIAYAFFR